MDASDSVRRLLLRVPKRRRVFEAIVACPGTHARRLSRDLGIALGVVEHHLRHLERHGLLYAHQQGRRRTLYATGHIDPVDARIIHALRKPVWCRLLAALAGQERGLPDLALELDLPPATVSYHLRRLRTLGLVDHLRVGREGAYLLLDHARVARLMEGFRPDSHEGAPHPALAGLVQRALALRPPRPQVRPGLVLAVKD
jgi:predicted transcriptional regulator